MEATSEIKCGETMIRTNIKVPAITASEAARRALEHARERLSVRLQNRLGAR